MKTIGRDRGGVDERGNAGGRHRAEDATAALDVDRPGDGFVAPGLDEPGEVDDGVGPREQRLQVVETNVGGAKRGPLKRAERRPACDGDNLVDTRIARQRAHDARANVAGRSHYDDAHAASLPQLR